jgi:hypothetical protein
MFVGDHNSGGGALGLRGSGRRPMIGRGDADQQMGRVGCGASKERPRAGGVALGNQDDRYRRRVCCEVGEKNQKRRDVLARLNDRNA